MEFELCLTSMDSLCGDRICSASSDYCLTPAVPPREQTLVTLLKERELGLLLYLGLE